jgi:CPA2 family monovalent cation:H+ antiporter-2
MSPIEAMSSAHEFLVALTIVLCVAGLTTIVFQRLRQPVVLGYILAGLIIGPHLPMPIVASPDVVNTLSELGVIAPLVQPVRDIFAAVFFVAVRMLIEPAQIATHWTAIVVFTLLVVGGKLAAVSFGAFMSGKGTKTSVAAGMSLAQIGEFSFIIAGLGLSLDVIGPYVYSVAVSVSAVTTLLTPALIRRSQRFASFVDRKLPKPLQTFVSLYDGWIEKLRSSRTESKSRLRRFARRLALDTGVIATVFIATSVSFDSLVRLLTDEVGITRFTAHLSIVSAAGLLVLPFCVSVLYTTRRFGQVLGETAVPRAAEGQVDLGRQPRRTIVAAVQLVGVLICGSALVAITQPFLPGNTAVIVFLLALAVLAIVFWRTATGLKGHVRAAAQAVLEVLGVQRGSESEASAGDPLEETRRLFPGLGAPVRHELKPASPVVGRSLADIELRSATGATVLAILRGDQGMAVPDAHAPLQAGDVLALAGTDEAIAAAIRVLDGIEQSVRPPAMAIAETR